MDTYISSEDTIACGSMLVTSCLNTLSRPINKNTDPVVNQVFIVTYVITIRQATTFITNLLGADIEAHRNSKHFRMSLNSRLEIYLNIIKINITKRLVRTVILFIIYL